MVYTTLTLNCPRVWRRAEYRIQIAASKDFLGQDAMWLHLGTVGRSDWLNRFLLESVSRETAGLRWRVFHVKQDKSWPVVIWTSVPVDSVEL